MNEESRARKGRALGLAIATMFATAPVVGCSESHAMPPDAATPADASTVADSASAADAAAAVDAASSVDAAVAVVDAATADAWEDIPDAYYPDGIRG
jgi:hypothetical protein